MNLVVAGKQAVTRQWWEERKEYFQLYISQYVLDEATGGDSEAAKRRIDVLDAIELLAIDEEVVELADKILAARLIPKKAETDAAHIAVAARHSIDFLLTWNCRHIANAQILSRINFVITEAGYNMPTICTPDELFGGQDDE
ncbi:MAG: type II toxin-antitoxin system VapC family toxin [Verrucomicrobiota bacterium]|nr:type II toxin-antitoxin system VapC family toxin [Verrucomicrobiota bacterium]